jgi:hypothetical protein
VRAMRLIHVDIALGRRSPMMMELEAAWTD